MDLSQTLPTLNCKLLRNTTVQAINTCIVRANGGPGRNRESEALGSCTGYAYECFQGRKSVELAIVDSGSPLGIRCSNERG